MRDYDVSSYTRRATDKGISCRIANSVAKGVVSFLDFIDKRQIDAYAISIVILLETFVIVDWAMDFINAHPDIDGLKAAAIIAAVTTPWSALQAAAIKFLFDARQESFEVSKETRSSSSRTTVETRVDSAPKGES